MKFIQSIYSKTLTEVDKRLDSINEYLKKQIEIRREKNEARELKRKNALKNFDNSSQVDPNLIQRKQTSMKASQGVSDHSGSAYKGPGNVDHEKVNSNMAQRNFDNHQGN